MSDGRTLFVAWLPDDTREDDVRSVFKRYGRIASCEMRSGRHKVYHRKRSSVLAGGNFRYAYIRYEDKRDAEVCEDSTFLF